MTTLIEEYRRLDLLNFDINFSNGSLTDSVSGNVGTINGSPTWGCGDRRKGLVFPRGSSIQFADTVKNRMAGGAVTWIGIFRGKFMPLNSRLQVTNISSLTIPANSRTQLAMQFSVIAPGATTVIAQITNSKGAEIGTAGKLLINISIFDSKVTGFTIGAAALLFFAALTQTIRRVRKGRNEDK